MKPLSSYYHASQQRTREEFCAAYPEPVFVVAPHATVETTQFKTAMMSPPTTGAVEVARVRKRTGANVFSVMVTIGRAKNNDIVIKAPGISKFHAFVRSEGERHLITDAGSTFGTQVNGATLTPQTERLELETNDEVTLGEKTVLTFYRSGALYDYLAALPPEAILGKEPTPN